MPYTAEISRTNPTCFVFLVDQSGSMRDPFGQDPSKKKCDGVADAINRLLQVLINTCTKGDRILDRFHVGVIGYGGTAVSLIVSANEEDDGQELIQISELANSPLRTETREKLFDDGGGDLIARKVPFPIWFEPAAYGITPMREAIELASRLVSRFIRQYPNCHPPVVINITDGAPDSPPKDVEDAAEDLRSLASSDGEVLMFNLHVSDLPNAPIEYPVSDSCLPDHRSRMLFNMSSIIPEPMRELAGQLGFELKPKSRGMVFNADLTSVIRFLRIGTVPSQRTKLLEYNS